MCKEGDYDPNHCTIDEHRFDVSCVPAKYNSWLESADRGTSDPVKMGRRVADRHVMSISDHGYNTAAG